MTQVSMMTDDDLHCNLDPGDPCDCGRERCGGIACGQEAGEQQVHFQVDRETWLEQQAWLAWLEQAEPEPENDRDERRNGDSRPTIRLGPELAEIVDECVNALAERARDLGVFQRGHCLVHVTSITPEEAAASPVVSVDASGTPRHELVAGTPVIHMMGTATLKETLTRVARFEKRDERRANKWKRCIPGDAVVDAVHARKKWLGIPNIIGVGDAPFMRPDGTVCQRPGFDAATGWLYAPSCAFPRVPDRPSQLDAHRAYKFVEETFADFPFEPEAHRSVPVAAALTELLRPAFDGCAPAFVFAANHRGVGKSLLTDAVANITTGRDMPRRGYPRSEEDMEKVIGAYAMRGATHFSLDNITGDFGGPTIDAVLSTPGDWEARILGTSHIATVPWRAVVYVTGHHFSFADESDTCDRVLMPYLQTDLENPRTRTGFRHPQLRRWIRENRGALVCALLTMARAWVVAGRQPQKDCPSWGTFDEWAALIPHIIVFAGGPSPMTARVKNEMAVSDSHRAMTCILEMWPKLQARIEEQERANWRRAADDAARKERPAPEPPAKRTSLTMAEVRHALYDDDEAGAAQGRVYGPAFDSMREAIETLCCPRQRAGRAAPTVQIMGKRLSKKKDTNIGGKRLRNVVDDHTKVAVWWVEDVAAGVAGIAGVVSPKARKLSPGGRRRSDDSLPVPAKSAPATPATPAGRKAAE